MDYLAAMTRRSLSHAIHETLLIGEPYAHVMATRALVRDWRQGRLESRALLSLREKESKSRRIFASWTLM